MKVAILAGGLGTRLAEETEVRPKPMVEVGGRPLLWHIMKHYSYHGFNHFVVALGYRGEYIKRYMVDYSTLNGSFSVNTKDGSVMMHEGQNGHESWTVDLVDTGLETQTGGRLKRMQPYLDGDTFLLTYGDGVSNVDLRGLVEFHRSHGRLATVTAVRPPARFGALDIEDGRVVQFREKPQLEAGWINGGFFVLEPGVFDYIDEDDDVVWEQQPLERLAEQNQLMAYQHDSFWLGVDTLRDKRLLESMWKAGDPPWRVWE